MISLNLDSVIEGFVGKRGLGILLKSELCWKHSKFCVQFCFRVLNNVLDVLFFPRFSSFLQYYVLRKNTISKGILWGPFVE